MIKLNVSAANITVEEKETLTEGRVGLLCQFRFTDEWTGLAKTAVFNGADIRDVILKSDTVTIPAECLASEGYSLCVGVYGKNASGDIVIPTVYATVGKIQHSAYPSGREPAVPTPDVVAQIQQAAANAEELARSVREDADLGKFNGAKGEKGDKGDKGDRGDAGEKGKTGPAGTDGGWYTPAVTQPDENTMRFAFTPSKEGMPAVPPKDITIPVGGGSGEAGGYYAPAVDADGNLSWTASKTDMPAVDGANIKGPKGDPGAAGARGPQGKSAYQYAVEGGYTGTEAEFAAKLAAEKFANPNALTFTGAVTGSYDGAEPLTVNIPSSGGGSGGGEAEFPNWRLIKTISFSADIGFVEFNTDDNGNTFSLKEIMLAGTVPAYASGSYIYMKSAPTGRQNSIWPTASKDLRWWAASVSGKLKTMLAVSNASVIWPVDKDPVCENDTISKLLIGASGGFTADGTMYVYGR